MTYPSPYIDIINPQIIGSVGQLKKYLENFDDSTEIRGADQLAIMGANLPSLVIFETYPQEYLNIDPRGGVMNPVCMVFSSTAVINLDH